MKTLRLSHTLMCPRNLNCNEDYLNFAIQDELRGNNLAAMAHSKTVK